MKKRRPILIVFVVLLLFIGFILVITSESEKSKAKKELLAARSYDQIKGLWKKFDEIQDRADWQHSVEQKILFLRPTRDQIRDLEEWYPVRRHLNITVVPDLSNRLLLPDQPKFDTAIINHVWKAFQQIIPSRYRYGQTMQDRLAIDISDSEAAQGRFKNLANELIFNLSSLGSTSPMVHLRKEESQFQSNVKELYELGEAGIRGADYRDFFDNRAISNIKKSTLFDHYRNIAILITDGYLEVSNGPYYTQSIPIPVNKTTDLEGLEVLMLEIHERKNGDYQNNKDLWYNWLSAMRANVNYNMFFQRHNDASSKTKSIIDEFLQDNSSITVMPFSKTSVKTKIGVKLHKRQMEHQKEVSESTTSAFEVTVKNEGKKIEKLQKEIIKEEIYYKDLEKKLHRIMHGGHDGDKGIGSQAKAIQEQMNRVDERIVELIKRIYEVEGVTLKEQSKKKKKKI